MNILQQKEKTELSPCPYFETRQSRFDYFFAHDLSGSELEFFLAHGWRKFGLFYFKPECPGCRECLPYRVRTRDFTPARDQRRIIQKNADIRVVFAPLAYSEEIYGMYAEHSRFRFNKEPEPEEQFIHTFYTPSCPSIQSEFYLDGKLSGVGFLDISDTGLSSVYFIYSENVQSRGMGVFGMIKEIEYARSRGLDYYYSGYYIENNSRMKYKGRYLPAEMYDWQQDAWFARTK